MAYLTDIELFNLIKKGEFKIEPFEPKLVRTIYIDLQLGNKFTTMMQAGTTYIDPAAGQQEEFVTKQKFATVEISEGGSFVIAPGEYVIGVSKENLPLSAKCFGTLFGRSSLGRIGLQVFCSGGFVDPGFSGNLTLEIYNASKIPIVLRSGMLIAKLAVETLQSAPTNLQPGIMTYDKSSELETARKFVDEAL